MVHGSTHHHPWTVLTLLRPSTDHSALVVIGRRACRRHGPWTRRTHRPVEAELGSNACKRQAGLSAPSVRSGPWQDRAEQHSTNHCTARPRPATAASHRIASHRIASGVQKAPAASQWTLLTFLTTNTAAGRYSVFTGDLLPVPSVTTRQRCRYLPCVKKTVLRVRRRPSRRYTRVLFWYVLYMVIDVPGVDACWWHAAAQCAYAQNGQHSTARVAVGAVRDTVPAESPDDDVAWQTGLSGMDVALGD
jgi:hypothetical protein